MSLTRTVMSLLRKPSAAPPKAKPTPPPKPQPTPTVEAEAPAEQISAEEYWWSPPEIDVAEEPALQVDLTAVDQHLENRLDRGTFSVIDIPSNILSIMQLLNDPDFDYRTVERLTLKSPVLAGQLIKVANSSAYSRGVKVNNLRVALPRLGPNRIRAVLYFNCSNRQLSNHPLFKTLATEIVDHSYAVAIIAGYLSSRYYPDPDTAFLAGLLHDIGKLAVLIELIEQGELLQSEEGLVNNIVIEQVLDRWHERAGAFIGNHWNLGDEVVAAIGHHHEYDTVEAAEDDHLVAYLPALINLSDVAARMLGYGRPLQVPNLFECNVFQSLGIDDTPTTRTFFQEIPELVNLEAE